MLDPKTYWLRLSPKFKRQEKHFDEGVTPYQAHRNTLHTQLPLLYTHSNGSPSTTQNTHTQLKRHKAALHTLLASPNSPNLPFATPQHANPTETNVHPILQLLDHALTIPSNAVPYMQQSASTLDTFQ